MKVEISAILLMGLLASCEKPTPPSQETSSPEISSAPANHFLAASQQVHARTLLDAGSISHALAYLGASYKADPSREKQRLIGEVLSSEELDVPTIRFTHPYPVTLFTHSENALYVALGGPFPTVVRWSLSEPERLPAILFPTRAKSISNLSLSPDGQYLIVHRDDTNLLCHAETLKPISALNPFPPTLHPNSLQPFTANSLLTASPSVSGSTLTWHIRDTATGQELSAATLPAHPAPSSAHFFGNDLHISLENGDGIIISPLGEISRTDTLQEHHHAIPLELHRIQFSAEDTTVTLHQIIPATPNDSDLLDAISGWTLDPDTQELKAFPVPDRLQLLHSRFTEISPPLRIFSADTPLKDRLAAAFPESFPELSAPSLANAEIVRASFATGDPALISATIAALPSSGLAPSTALFLAHRSGNPEWIAAVVAKTENLPAPLRDIGTPNIPIPEIAELRRQQDWLGFEAPDFSPLFKSLSEAKSETLTKITLPADPSEDQVAEFIAAIQTEETLLRLGSSAIADSAIQAAAILSSNPSHAASAIGLTIFAERYGASRSSVLRIRAEAHTTLGDFESAHRSWLELITHLPENQHLASDYAEAAYTAFETAAPDQAIEILKTGIFRFPNDVTFAIRASWIALLTGHPEQAADYLANATRIGIPGNEVENTTALLAIVHTQLGDTETAYGYLEQLIAIDPAWSAPDTIEKLPWPEPLKTSLRQLTWHP